MRPLARLVPVIAALLVVPAPAWAHGPTDCTDGPARLATADTPHMVDVHGDGRMPYSALFGTTADLIGGWVSGPSAWEDRFSTQKFIATMRVEALDRHPFLGRFYFVFEGADGIQQWVRGEADGTDLQWLFSYGHLEGTTYTRDGATTGSVDTAAGTVNIEIPSELLPVRPADGTELTLGIIEAETFLRLPVSPVVTGNLQSVDIAMPGCTAVLYEAAPVIA